MNGSPPCATAKALATRGRGDDKRARLFYGIPHKIEEFFLEADDVFVFDCHHHNRWGGLVDEDFVRGDCD